MKPIGNFERIVVIAIVSVLVGGAYYLFYVLPRGELGQAPKWSVLQYVEQAHRKDSKSSTPIVIPRSDNLAYSVLGIPTNLEGSPFVWILLDGGDDSYGPIKMMPQGVTFRIDCKFVDDLPKKYAVDKPVLIYLQKNCRSGAE